MWWCGERNGRSADERTPAPRRPDDALDARDLERLGARQRRAGSTADAGRAWSCRSPAVRSAAGCARRRRRWSARRGPRLAAHVGQVGRSRRPRRARRPARPRVAGSSTAPTAQDRRRLGRARRAGTSRPATSAASRAFRRDQQPVDPRARRTPSATASMPRPGRIAPPSDSSPKTAQRSSAPAGTCPLAARIPQAMARSKPGPDLRSVGGREVRR